MLAEDPDTLLADIVLAHFTVLTAKKQHYPNLAEFIAQALQQKGNQKIINLGVYMCANIAELPAEKLAEYCPQLNIPDVFIQSLNSPATCVNALTGIRAFLKANHLSPEKQFQLRSTAIQTIINALNSSDCKNVDKMVEIIEQMYRGVNLEDEEFIQFMNLTAQILQSELDNVLKSKFVEIIITITSSIGREHMNFMLDFDKNVLVKYTFAENMTQEQVRQWMDLYNEQNEYQQEENL